MICQYQSYENCGSRRSTDLYSKYQCTDRKSSASSTISTSSSGSNQSICPQLTQVSRQVLASTFQRNWNNHFSNQRSHDESLTNLNWLNDVNPVKINEQLSFTPSLEDPKNSVGEQMFAPSNPSVYTNQQWPTPQPMANELPSSCNPPDYRHNPNLKPPFSYAILISWAMKELKKPKITLSDIYSWIIGNFAYYRHSDTSWQNSIRHNLSLGKCFEKVPRRKDEPGKGGFWRINPLHSRTLDINLAKIKYNPSVIPNDIIKSDNSFLTKRVPAQQISIAATRHSYSTTAVKRSRKTPLTVAHEDWEPQDQYNSSVTLDDINNCMTKSTEDLSYPFDNSSQDSINYGASSSDPDISLSSINNLDDLVKSPMLLNNDDSIEHDDFKMFSSNNDFADLFFSTKDDLHELDCLLGIF